MKYYIIYILTLMISFSIFGQENTKKKDANEEKWKVELLTTYDFLNKSYGKNGGFIAKAKYKFLDSKHFNMFYGAAYQNSYISETDNKFTEYVDGYTRDIGVYTVFEIVYFPLKKKNVYLAIEPFIGTTHLKSKGKLNIAEHYISEKYTNNYLYFNYGISQSIGYKFNKFSIGAFVWSSLKGFFDEGRFRPGDFDSRLFIGLGASYNF